MQTTLVFIDQLDGEVFNCELSNSMPSPERYIFEPMVYDHILAYCN